MLLEVRKADCDPGQRVGWKGAHNLFIRLNSKEKTAKNPKTSKVCHLKGRHTKDVQPQ